jgi:pimeloyl-ACP methyl ester carboxylesterase
VIVIPFITYLDKQIYFQIKDNNSEKALIFIHGSGGNSNIWHNQLKLNVDYNVIAIDLPSHSKSDKFKNLSLDLYTDVLRQLINILSLKSVVLGGHSLGGAVIQDYYFKFPNEVSGLLLIGTGGRLRVSPAILKAIKNDYNNYVENLFAGAFYRKTSNDILLNTKQETLKTSGDVTYSDFSICDRFDTLAKTPTIQIPCLIICGSEDSLTPVKYSEYFHKKLEFSELIIIKEAGHMVMVEKPEEVNSSIEKFIATNL